MAGGDLADNRVVAVDPLGFVLRVQASVGTQTAAEVGCRRDDDLGASRAEHVDRLVELASQVGVERRLTDVRPAAADHAIHQLPAPNHEHGHLRPTALYGLDPPRRPVVALRRLHGKGAEVAEGAALDNPASPNGAVDDSSAEVPCYGGH